MDYLHYGRDIDQSSCSSNAHELPHAGGALLIQCLIEDGLVFIHKERNVTPSRSQGVLDAIWISRRALGEH